MRTSILPLQNLPCKHSGMLGMATMKGGGRGRLTGKHNARMLRKLVRTPHTSIDTHTQTRTTPETPVFKQAMTRVLTGFSTAPVHFFIAPPCFCRLGSSLLSCRALRSPLSEIFPQRWFRIAVCRCLLLVTRTPTCGNAMPACIHTTDTHTRRRAHKCRAWCARERCSRACMHACMQN